MVDLLDKISSYDLFNYLLTGIIFVILAGQFTRYSFIQQDIITGLFLYYFIGLVISRIGSLAIEPLLKRVSFIHFAAYNDYLTASEKDPDMKLFSQVNNTYRTFCSLFIVLLLLNAYEWIQFRIPSLMNWDQTIFMALMLIIFLYSYRKQTGYITKRIKVKE